MTKDKISSIHDEDIHLKTDAAARFIAKHPVQDQADNKTWAKNRAAWQNYRAKEWNQFRQKGLTPEQWTEANGKASSREEYKLTEQQLQDRNDRILRQIEKRAAKNQARKE
jgi:hypothetical protein